MEEIQAMSNSGIDRWGTYDTEVSYGSEFGRKLHT